MPGAVFEYSSGAVLETPLGKMEGSYQMIGEDGLPFEAPIKTFRLAVPNVLN
jgi:ApaG protein